MHFVAAVFAYALIAGLRLLFLRIKHIEAIGLGDAKLLAALAFWLGPESLSPTLLIASLTGILFHIATEKSQLDKIPFGPFLIISALLIFYYGAFQ